jgi:hypothetical protein
MTKSLACPLPLCNDSSVQTISTPIHVSSTPLATTHPQTSRYHESLDPTSSSSPLGPLRGSGTDYPSHIRFTGQSNIRDPGDSSPDPISGYPAPSSPNISIGNRQSVPYIPDHSIKDMSTKHDPLSSPNNPFQRNSTSSQSMPSLRALDFKQDFSRGLKRPRLSDTEEPLSPRFAQHTLSTPVPTAGTGFKSEGDAVEQELQLATQIPDFVRYVFLRTENGTVKRVDLFVENKRTYKNKERYIPALASQAFKQAHHIFINNPDVRVVGCIT